MPSHLKQRVRSRMAKTGESHQQALRRVRAEETRAPEAQHTSERAATVADTAFSIAVVRAEEALRPPSERLFEDPYAALFAEAGAHAAESTQRFLELSFFRDGVRLRTRYIDDVVRAGLAAGLRQLVLLGAGFDMRGLRLKEVEATGTTVYEVDTRGQLARKKDVLDRAGVRLPKRVKLAPVDFDEPDFEGELAKALRAKGFQRGRGAMFVWEGVIGYIDARTIDRSLRAMASLGGPGTRLVFTYAHVTFDEETAEACTRRAGFTSCEEVASDELWRRYLGTEPHPHAWAMKIGTAFVQPAAH